MGPVCTTPTRWVALVSATYRSLRPRGEASSISAGSAMSTESNSRPLACRTVSTTTGLVRSGSAPTAVSGSTVVTARASWSSRAGGTITASLPSPVWPASVTAALATASARSSSLACCRHGATPASRTERGTSRAGSMAASTSAATSMTSAGVR